MKTRILLFVGFLTVLLIPACMETSINPREEAGDPGTFNAFDDTQIHQEKNILNFTAHLSGSAEVPANDSKATGQAIFQYNRADSSMYYKVIVANIQNVHMAHIHLAPAGSNGGVVVWLYPDAPPAQLIPGRTQGILAEGTIAYSSLRGALAGMSIEVLIDHIESGNAYVNVHTSQYGGGEIRGQIK